MDATLVQDVVAEVMKRLGNRAPGGLRAGEDAPANEGKRIEAESRGTTPPPGDGRFGIFASVDDAVIAATEAQMKLAKLSLDDRDAIVKLVKQMAKDNARPWGQMEFDETKIGRLDHKIEKLQILEL